MRVSAVIGACYGDEGKGHAVDWLADEGSVVVRFNGGAQAGHTVTAPDGRRQVFHHIGAGALRGAATYLSRHFIVNPLLYHWNRKELNWLTPFPRVMVDWRARLTTPFDMILNQEVENLRGKQRHGSCGTGINETVTRCETKYATFVEDIEGVLHAQMLAIRDEWLPRRAEALGLEWHALPDYVFKDSLIDHFMDDCRGFLAEAKVTGIEALAGFKHIVFEGAQGLGLDELGPDFPHVTRSRTGLPNVLQIVKEAGLERERIDAYYAMRPYMTRHGRGPLLHELREKPFRAIEDLTNIPNEYQESLRFGWVDLDQVGNRILLDSTQTAGLHVRPALIMSCVDQVTDRVTVFKGGRELRMAPQELAEAVAYWAGLDGYAWFEGPTRDNVRGDRAITNSTAKAV